MTNEERLRTAYERHLRAAVERRPKAFRFSIDKVPAEAAKTTTALRSASIHSITPLIRTAARECGIERPTPLTIAYWLNGTTTAAETRPPTPLTNEERFRAIYERRLRGAVERNPHVYHYPPDRVPEVVGKMIAALKRREGAIGPVIRATAKECGIARPGIATIAAFLNDTAER